MPAKGKKSGKEGRLSLLPEVTTARGPSHARTKPRLRPTPFKATSSERRLRTDSHAPRHLHGEPELLVTRIFCVTNLHSDDGVHGVTLVRVHAGGIVKQRSVKSCKQECGHTTAFGTKIAKNPARESSKESGSGHPCSRRPVVRGRRPQVSVRLLSPQRL
jgi:hypothetical protein